MSKRLVIAMGGNALGKTPDEQLKQVEYAASAIVDLVEEGYDVVIGHGNGPQVGMVNRAFEFTANNDNGMPPMPFPECGAMTQGYIGYHLQQVIGRELNRRGIDMPCASVLTQVVVDRNDPAFSHPTKPVGMFYNKEQAEAIAAETGYTFVEDAGRGYRRVVPSPKPEKIVELPVVERLVSAHSVVITVGGGGIPVEEVAQGDYRGVAAVIDKDLACALLARNLHADMLLILTAVEKVAVNFNRPDRHDINTMTVDEARDYIRQGQFAPGSMLPKVEACINFVENADGGTAIITSLDKAREALRGTTGTVLKKT